MTTTTTTATTMSVDQYVDHVADRAASREADTLFDFYSLGRYVVTGEATYEQVRDLAVAAFKVRNLAPATAKTYVSQGFTLAQLFDTYDDVETFADDECNGSRSLKRIVTATKDRGGDDEAGTDDEATPDEAPATTTDDDRATAILAILSGMTDPAAIARVHAASAPVVAVAAA